VQNVRWVSLVQAVDTNVTACMTSRVTSLMASVQRDALITFLDQAVRLVYQLHFHHFMPPVFGVQKNPGFFSKKPNPVGFLGFVTFILGFLDKRQALLDVSNGKTLNHSDVTIFIQCSNCSLMSSLTFSLVNCIFMPYSFTTSGS